MVGFLTLPFAEMGLNALGVISSPSDYVRFARLTWWLRLDFEPCLLAGKAGELWTVSLLSQGGEQ